jgi:hypothetical protein
MPLGEGRNTDLEKGRIPNRIMESRASNSGKWLDLLRGGKIPHNGEGRGGSAFGQDAMTHWAQNTIFSFVERASSNESHYRNYVMFERGEGCSSAVGMQGGTFSGKQQISLATGCDLGSASHEIGHAVGLWHEQSRQDRDSHVEILWENIEAGKEHNFNQHITDGDDIGPYDFGSIMHYSRTAFGRRQPDGSRLETIVPHGGQAIGQRAGLSARDREGVKALYTDWTPWQPLGGATFSDPAVTLGLRKGMVVFVRGTDNQVHHRWQHVRDGEWSGWESLGGATPSSPAATTYRDGRLVVFVRGTDSLIWYRWHVRENGEWSQWKRLGDPRAGGQGATTVPGFWSGNEYWIGWLSVFARGSDNALWHRRLAEMVWGAPPS